MNTGASRRQVDDARLEISLSKAAFNVAEAKNNKAKTMERSEIRDAAAIGMAPDCARSIRGAPLEFALANARQIRRLLHRVR